MSYEKKACAAKETFAAPIKLHLGKTMDAGS